MNRRPHLCLSMHGAWEEEDGARFRWLEYRKHECLEGMPMEQIKKFHEYDELESKSPKDEEKERSDYGRIHEILHEHTESLAMLLSITSSMREEMVELKNRVADMEAKLAYYVSEKENSNRIIQ